MPITITKALYSNRSYVPGGSPSSHFVGRVIQVEKRSERRNLSDTLDYSHFQTVTCTHALVWLGTHGFAPDNYGDRPKVDFNGYGKDARELEPWEQFAWIDCSNLFTWRGCDHYEAHVDAVLGESGDPIMWVNYISWQGYLKANAKAERLRREAAEKAHREALDADNAKRAKKAASDNAKRDIAAKGLETAPKKGDRITVNGVTGKVFWTGTTKYRGKWSARLGIKDSSGTAHWFDVEQCKG